jgi:hypothetical protein
MASCPTPPARERLHPSAFSPWVTLLLATAKLFDQTKRLVTLCNRGIAQKTKFERELRFYFVHFSGFAPPTSQKPRAETKLVDPTRRAVTLCNRGIVETPKFERELCGNFADIWGFAPSPSQKLCGTPKLFGPSRGII